MFKRKTESSESSDSINTRSSQRLCDFKKIKLDSFKCKDDLCVGKNCVYKKPLLEFPSPRLNNPRRSLLDSTCNLQVIELLYFGRSMNMVETMEKELKKTRNPNKVCNALRRFLPSNCIPDGWDITAFLGKGSFGNVFSTIGPGNTRGALKIMVDHYDVDHGDSDIMESTKREEAMLEQQNSNKFHEYGLSPKTTWMCSHHLFDDDKNAKTLYVTHMIRMRSLNFTHGDFHAGNIGYVFLDGISPTPHFQIIDHGFVSTKKSSPVVDIGQLLRVIVDKELSPDMNETNRKFMNKFIRENAKRLFDLDFPIHEDDIEAKYMEDRLLV